MPPMLASLLRTAASVARGGEQIRLGGEERGLFAGLEEARVGLLHEVVDIEVRGEFGAEVGAQLRFVGLHLFGKPAGGLGVRRGHSGVWG
jgi:hypothetical protein